jgi:predicted N-acetyltransferase YhbS
MIAHPNENIRADVRALWQTTFGDSDAFLSRYFARMHRDENMLVCVEDDEELVAMLTMLPITLKSGGRAFPARYIYAVATAEPWRGLGISTSLMAHALDLMRENGEKAAILVPAHFSLFGFYERQGFSTAFYAREQAVDAADLPAPQGTMEDIGAADLRALRERAFAPSCLFASWDEHTLGYIIDTVTGDGGAAVRFSACGGEGYAVAAMDEELCVVKELFLDGISVPQALSLLHGRMGARRYILHLSAAGDDDPMPFGMIRWLDDEAERQARHGDQPPYFALVMD